MMRWNAVTLRCGVLALAFVSLGCNGEDAGAPLIPDSALVMRKLDINYEAVMLTRNAPYDTVQLRALPIALNGDTLPFENPVVYYRAAVRDTSVQVDSFTGMVRARATTAGTNVIARLTMGTDTFYDTVRIMVRNDVNFRRVGRVEINPTFAGDSAVRWAGFLRDLSLTGWIRVYDTANVPIIASQRIVSITSPPQEEYVNPRTTVSSESYAHVRLYAHGREFRDSVLFRRIVPPVRFVVIDRFVPVDGEPTIALYPFTTRGKVGTTVYFMNMFGHGTYHPNDDPFGFGTCISPSNFCGNRIRYSTREGFVGSEMVWTDSVDIVFDQPSMAMAGDSFGFVELAMRRGVLSPGTGSGNIPAFSVRYCRILSGPPLSETDTLVNNTCGTSTATDPTFTEPPILDPGMRGRKFTTPGTYIFTSTRYPGVTGTIIITP